MTSYDLIASGIERILAVPRPKTDAYNGLSAKVVLPPVALMSECFLEAGDNEFFPPHVVTPDLLDHVNFAMMSESELDGVMSFNWIRNATQKDRRSCRRHSKHMLKLTLGGVSGTKWFDHQTTLWSWLGNRWVDATAAVHAGDCIKMDAGAVQSERINMLLSVALNARYNYGLVLLDNPNNLAVRMYASPRTIRFLLKTREIGNARRRAALVHLVRTHTRRRKHDSRVMAHHRGEIACRWAGLDVRVVPSQFEIDTLKKGLVADRINSDPLAARAIALSV